jgi:hypothetical protein
VSSLVATSPPLTEPLSPELVLVSPPDVASVARFLLPERPQPAVERLRTEIARLRPLELTVAYAVCLTATLGPLLFVVLARTIY